MSFGGLLNKTVDIERASNTVGPMGSTQTWSASTSNAVCAIQPRGGGQSQDPIAAVVGSTHVAYFDSAVDIRPEEGNAPGDRIKYGSIYYTVLYVEDMAGRGKYQKAYLKLTS